MCISLSLKKYSCIIFRTNCDKFIIQSINQLINSHHSSLFIFLLFIQMILEWMPAIGLFFASSLQLRLLFPPPLSVFPPRCPLLHSLGHMPWNIIERIRGLFHEKVNPLVRVFPPNMPFSIRQCFVAILFAQLQGSIAKFGNG